MDIILIVFILFALCGSKFIRSGGEEYLSPKATNALRGILAVGIILHHMSERTSGGILFPFMQHMGYLFVAVFFFLSGYGLMAQYIKKGKDYLRSFWLKRIAYIAIIYLIFTALYAVYKVVLGEGVSVKTIILSFVNGSPFVPNSWYVIVQIILYILFWIVFTLLGDKRKLSITVIFVLTALLVPLFKSLGCSSIWYISNFGFVLGLIWAEEKERIESILSSRFWLSAILTLAVFAVFSGIPLVLEHLGFDSNAIRTVCRLVSPACFAAFMAIILFKWRPGGWVWDRLGAMSLEIYLIHGIVIGFLRSGAVNIKSEILWTCAAIIISVFLAYPLHKLDSLIGNFLKRSGKK